MNEVRKMVSNRYVYGFHSFLYDYLLQNGCKAIMEIGVADGRNAVEMVNAALQNFSPEEVEYYGFDFFGGIGDSQLKLVSRTLGRTGCRFKLFKGDSAKTLPKVAKNLPMMDLIFIDGGHSFSTVKSDWKNSKLLMHNETAVFFHNYNFSGPKKVVENISREEYSVKIIDPPSDYRTALVKRKRA